MSTTRQLWITSAAIWLAVAATRPAHAQEINEDPTAPPKLDPAAAAEVAQPIPSPYMPAGAVATSDGSAQQSGPVGTGSEQTIHSLSKPHERRAGRHPGFWQRMREGFLGHPDEFDAPPLGHAIEQHRKVQTANAEAASMVLYNYDFVEGRETLSRRGRSQLVKMAALLPKNFYPIVIELTPEAAGLAEARRRAIVKELAGGSFPIPVERVVVGSPIAHGLNGVDAEHVNQNMSTLTQTGGAPLQSSRERPIQLSGQGTGAGSGRSASPATGLPR